MADTMADFELFEAKKEKKELEGKIKEFLTTAEKKHSKTRDKYEDIFLSGYIDAIEAVLEILDI